MAEFTPSKKTAQDFNNGVEYINEDVGITGDALQAETINNLVESALYTQEQAEGAVSAVNGAVDTANNALAVANGLNEQIKTANITADMANTTSQEAKNIAEEAKEIATDAQKGVGTKVTVGGEVVTTFDADTKVNKSGDIMAGKLIVPQLDVSNQSTIEIAAEAVTPHIDFHYNNDTGDFTSRIIEEQKGVLNIWPILHENGQRVYSPNNKPTLNTLGIRGGSKSFNNVSFVTINHGLGKLPQTISIIIMGPSSKGTNYFLTGYNETIFSVQFYASNIGSTQSLSGTLIWGVF